jgi:hypothetical protein
MDKNKLRRALAPVRYLQAEGFMQEAVGDLTGTSQRLLESVEGDGEKPLTDLASRLLGKLTHKHIATIEGLDSLYALREYAAVCAGGRWHNEVSLPPSDAFLNGDYVFCMGLYHRNNVVIGANSRVEAVKFAKEAPGVVDLLRAYAEREQ